VQAIVKPRHIRVVSVHGKQVLGKIISPIEKKSTCLASAGTW
jgi:hypothetical protein